MKDVTFIRSIPFFFIMLVSLVPFSSRQPPTSKWHKISLINCFCLFVCLYVAWKRGILRKCARFVLFRLIKKRSFNLLCVFDPFQFYTSKILYPQYFSPVACTPRQVIRDMTSDFDICKVDLDTFLNAVPYESVPKINLKQKTQIRLNRTLFN